MEQVGWSFACGSAVRSDGMFFARERDDLTAQGVIATSFYIWNEQNPDPAARWSIYSEVANWRALGMASVKVGSAPRVTVALGSKGQYFELEPAIPTQYLGAIPDLDVLVRRVVAVEEVIFAVGMGRSVIRRVDRGNWIEFGPGTTDADRDQIVGFEEIDGNAANDMYTVGWRGEIWHWSGGTWRQIDSPTNANLNAVACDAKGEIFAVGDNGSMVRGAGDVWDFVDTGRAENLQDVAAFEGQVFVVTDHRILLLGPAGLVEEDRFVAGDRPGTCLHLLPAQDGSGVISMGPKDLFAFSGGIWRRIV